MKTIEIQRHSIRSKPEDPLNCIWPLMLAILHRRNLKKAYDLAVEAKKLINGMISYLGKN